MPKKGSSFMIDCSREDYLDSIDFISGIISRSLFPEVVAGVLDSYGAKCVDDISDYDLPNVYGELLAIYSDIAD